ncbi:MAG: NPCBM/NEW2 domain-containing protein [Phycisphaerae bacterium]
MPPRRRCALRFVCGLPLCMLALGFAPPGDAGDPGAVSMAVERIDGTRLAGRWIGADGATFTLGTDTGATRIELDALSTVRRRAPSAPSPPPVHRTTLYLRDGGRWHATLLDGAPGGITVRTAVADPCVLPFDALAAVRLGTPSDDPDADGLFGAALDKHLTAQDVLVTRGDTPKAVRGTLLTLGAQAASFRFGGRDRTLATRKIYAVVLAAGAGKPTEDPSNRPAYRAMFTLTDGSTVGARIVRADARTVRVETSFGLAADLALVDIAAIDFHSSRVVYVSDMSPMSEQTSGMLHAPWPVQYDRSASGQPLSLGGRRFDKGIGVHSRCELAYALDGAYESFVATIGIDDAVRPRGSVVFRVIGDDNVLLDSGPVTGNDKPRPIAVDVAGVTRLTLLVDFGAGLDLADHADWADARLLKPPRAIDRGIR